MKDLATKNTKDTKKVWPTVRLGDVCVIKLGKTPPRGVGNCWDNEKMSGNVWVTIADMANTVDGKIQDSKEYITDYAIEASGIPVVEEGTLLLSFKLTLGRTAIAGKNLYTNEAIAALPIKPEFASNIDLAYLVTYFSFFDWVGFAANDEKLLGKTLNKKKLAEVPVLLPPLSTQREIVARLEKELGEADKLAAKFKRVAELADDAFKAELDETFKALEDNSRRDAETRRVRLGDVCEFRRGLTYSKSDESELSSNVVLRSNNVSLETGKLDFTELKYLKETFVIPADKKVVQNSLLMCMANGSKPHLGKVALIDKDYGYAFGGFMGLLVPNDIDQKYLYLALTSSQFKSRIKSLQDGANINNLKYIDIADFQFPLPPLPAQRAIVAKLDAAKEWCEKLKAVAMCGLAAAENLRKAILAEAFEQ